MPRIDPMKPSEVGRDSIKPIDNARLMVDDAVPWYEVVGYKEALNAPVLHTGEVATIFDRRSTRGFRHTTPSLLQISFFGN